ncbi:hypothetical protein [Streptomyces sp. NPDC026673]
MRALFAPVARKSGWRLAEQADHAALGGLRHLLAGARLEADDIRGNLHE